ncbi:PAS domain-containing protein [Tenacibaculum sp. Ill]|uniref:PAS domain-containing protein n=1 Tax=Tenacibaculum sp. Ill TaxID=3445935 RepID=UPI003F78B39E
MTNNLEKKWENHSNENQKRKPKLVSPTPVDREINLDENSVLLSITDTRGVIEYCNEDFVESSGYEEYELVGSGHNIVRHPDMPRVIFKLMWKRIQNKENIIAFVKNMAKTGRYYWVMTDFVVKENDKGEVINYKALRKPAPKNAVQEIIPLYKRLREIEDLNGIEASEKFLKGFLDSKNTNYDVYIEKLITDNIGATASGTEEGKKKGSFFKRFFGIE